jgi:hypothetical protein
MVGRARASSPAVILTCTWLQALAKLMTDLQNPEFARMMEDSLKSMGGTGMPGLPGTGEGGLDTETDQSIAAVMNLLTKM